MEFQPFNPPFFSYKWAQPGQGTSALGAMWDLGSGNTLVAGSGVTSPGSQVLQSLNATIAQGGTSSYAASIINVIETTTGSGSKMLCDWKVGPNSGALASKFSVDNAGNLVVAGTVTAGGVVLGAGGGTSDALARRQVAPGVYATGNYYFCNSMNNPGTLTPGNNECRVSLWIVTDTITIASLFAEYTAAGQSGAVFRFGIWNDASGLPGALVVDAGTVAMDATPGSVEKSVSQTLSPGAYWIGGAMQSAATTRPTLRATNSNALSITRLGTSLPGAGASGGVWYQNSVSGSFGTFTGTPLLTNTAPRIGFKIA
jgi:hypothetical protein